MNCDNSLNHLIKLLYSSIINFSAKLNSVFMLHLIIMNLYGTTPALLKKNNSLNLHVEVLYISVHSLKSYVKKKTLIFHLLSGVDTELFNN